MQPNTSVLNGNEEKGKKEKFRLSFSLHWDDGKAVQYHIKWAGEDGCSHSLSNMDKNQLENQEE